MRLRPQDPDERGAIAILTALLTVVVLAVAALGVDITRQVNERQKLHDTIDAAALAGAYQLPGNGGQAKVDALAFAARNDPAAPVPDVAILCVVGSIWNAATSKYVVDPNQISATCNRSVGTSTAGSSCNASICSLPCVAAADRCNVIRVVGTKPVPFSFAPAIGISQGSTGSLTSAACKGPCGNTPLNPMDVAVVADRTSSMNDDDVRAMRDGINGMFQTMTPSQQYVTLGTIGRSMQGPATATWCGSTMALSEPSTSETQGPWMPVPFSWDYLNAGTNTLNTGSPLVKAVNCLANMTGGRNPTVNKSGTGTHLASAMKSAARYLLGLDPNNLPSPETRTGTIRKAIIFETDGAPNESITTNLSLTALNPAGDIENNDKDKACTNLKTVATNAKTATPGILVVTVAYNVAMTDKCNGNSGARLDQTLAAAASPAPSGAASLADQNCADASVGGGRYKENTDLDYFFCAGSTEDMAPIFVTALAQIANGSRLIALP